MTTVDREVYLIWKEGKLLEIKSPMYTTPLKQIEELSLMDLPVVNVRYRKGIQRYFPCTFVKQKDLHGENVIHLAVSTKTFPPEFLLALTLLGINL